MKKRTKKILKVTSLSLVSLVVVVLGVNNVRIRKCSVFMSCVI
ncbi:hypothetical protein [Bacteroides sp. An19]|nr:hypothetical protein [Bacteroides sp. An19]